MSVTRQFRDILSPVFPDLYRGTVVVRRNPYEHCTFDIFIGRSKSHEGEVDGKRGRGIQVDPGGSDSPS